MHGPKLTCMFDAVKGVAVSAAVISSVMTVQPGMAEQAPLVINLPGLSEQPEEPGPEAVDRMVVFAIDISKSVENDEYRAMMKGFYDAALSDDLTQQLRAGMSFAFATVFFCGKAQMGEVGVIRTGEDAKAFAEKAFWDSEKGHPYDIMPCSHTNIAAGLGEARDLIEREDRLGITSLERSIIVAGDGVNSPYQPLLRDVNRLTVALAEEHKAIVYGIPITMHDDSGKYLVDYYAQIVTPPGMSYDTGEGYTYPLKEGKVTRAHGFADVAAATRETFMLSMY